MYRNLLLYCSDMSATILFMPNPFTISELKDIYKHAIFSHFLSVQHEKKLFKLIKEKNPPLHIELALEILSISPNNCLKLIEEFHLYPFQTQAYTAITLSSYQDNVIQTKLFDLIETIENEEILNTLLFSMGKSPYLNIAPILDKLYSEDKKIIARITELLEITPLKKFEIFIAGTPELPHEALFRRIYGNEAINYLRGTTTNSLMKSD